MLDVTKYSVSCCIIGVFNLRLSINNKIRIELICVLTYVDNMK